MTRLLGRAILGVLMAAGAVFALDWAVWRARVATGSGMGSVEVSRMQVAALKGSKEEYYWDGTAEVDCSRSLFPQAGAGACWWIERHKTVFER